MIFICGFSFCFFGKIATKTNSKLLYDKKNFSVFGKIYFKNLLTNVRRRCIMYSTKTVAKEDIYYEAD